LKVRHLQHRTRFTTPAEPALLVAQVGHFRGTLTQQSRRSWIPDGFALTRYDAGLGQAGFGAVKPECEEGITHLVPADCLGRGDAPARLRKHTPARGRPGTLHQLQSATLNKQSAWSRG
jgi:hypothetical protein